MKHIAFLKSNRFWALVVLAVVMYLNSLEIIPANLAQSFMILLGGHIGIRTIDRGTEKFGSGKND